tara:strand:- start:1452 stop:1655 length:204 start_codon:yes stop_codon:yes gene_type:complete
MSLVENINKRKKTGTSRKKSKSTISDKAYKDMQEGWPNKKDGGPVRVFIAKGCGKVMNKRRKKTKEY